MKRMPGAYMYLIRQIGNSYQACVVSIDEPVYSSVSEYMGEVTCGAPNWNTSLTELIITMCLACMHNMYLSLFNSVLRQIKI